MQKLISELTRLYCPSGALAPAVLAQNLLGKTTLALSLVTSGGQTSAIVIPFGSMADGDDTRHWTLLCEVANALQVQLGLPAPAVSISGTDGYKLWLSLADPVPVSLAQQFLERLHAAYFPDLPLAPDTASAPVELPPCLHHASGKWAAFIHPGLGASFAGEAGLEMAPPFAGQSALLEGLHSITPAQFAHALAQLQPAPAPATFPAPAVTPALPAGLLLKDATLEEIVRHLHARQIEPTFRYLIPNPD